MKKQLAIVLALSMVVAFIGSPVAQAGVMGSGGGGIGEERRESPQPRAAARKPAEHSENTP